MHLTVPKECLNVREGGKFFDRLNLPSVAIELYDLSKWGVGGGGSGPWFQQACLKWWAMQKVQSHQHHQSRYSGHKTNFKRNELMECFYEQKSHKSQHQKKWFFTFFFILSLLKDIEVFFKGQVKILINFYWLVLRKLCQSEKILSKKRIATLFTWHL